MNIGGVLKARGKVAAKRIRIHPPDNIGFADFWEFVSPFATDDLEIKKWRWKQLIHVLPQYFKIRFMRVFAKITGVMVADSCLSIVVRRGDGRIQNFGIASFRLVTDNGVGFIVDAFQNLVEAENMKFHGLGTGIVAEAQTDSALGTELTTEYTGDVRATGSLTEGATPNIFKTVGTNTLDSGTPAITEHGVFTQAATGGGVLLDRSKFAAINLVGANGDSLQSTYSLTLTAGG